MPDQPSDLDTDDLYRIGTVAKLTGVSVERLRAWERRYGLSPSHRAGKIRFYSRDQVERLRRIRTLTDSGQAISSLIDLTDEQLSARLGSTTNSVADKPSPAAQQRERRQSQIALVGTNLLLLNSSDDTDNLKVGGRWASLDALRAEAVDMAQLDALVIQIGTANQKRIDEIATEFPTKTLVVLFQYALPGFSPTLPIDRPEPLRVEAWTGQWADVVTATQAALSQRQHATSLEARHFTDAELIGIAGSLDSDTGLPAHIVDLVTRLNALGEFATDCEQSAQKALVDDSASALRDAAVAASKARLLLEQSLERWLEGGQLESDDWLDSAS